MQQSLKGPFSAVSFIRESCQKTSESCQKTAENDRADRRRVVDQRQLPENVGDESIRKRKGAKNETKRCHENDMPFPLQKWRGKDRTEKYAKNRIFHPSKKTIYHKMRF